MCCLLHFFLATLVFLKVLIIYLKMPVIFFILTRAISITWFNFPLTLEQTTWWMAVALKQSTSRALRSEDTAVFLPNQLFQQQHLHQHLLLFCPPCHFWITLCIY